jgi:cytochrome c biogenesis protein CcmG/thiol:disulfide interchange protein DsbE
MDASQARPAVATGLRWWIFTLAVLALGMAWTFQSRVPAAAAGTGQIASPREGFPAPDFTLPALGGGDIRLADQAGQVVIINLWASWCPPCRAEMPAIEQVYVANRDRGLVVLAVNSTYQDNEDSAARFAQDLGLTFPILFDRDGAVSRRYRLRALPTTFFVDRRGLIRSVVVGGPMSPAVLQSQVEPLLAEAP